MKVIEEISIEDKMEIKYFTKTIYALIAENSTYKPLISFTNKIRVLFRNYTDFYDIMKLRRNYVENLNIIHERW